MERVNLTGRPHGLAAAAPRDIRFALLSHEGTDNLGDDIQAIAARAFLPRVDRLLPRERLDEDPGEPLALILNGWYMNEPAHWPPNPALAPLVTSFHLSDRRPRRWRLWQPTPAVALLAREGGDYLRAHGPVGARDRATLALLRANGVEAHLSGCLTLTLKAPPGVKLHGRVVACDLPDAALAELARRIGEAPIAVTHRIDPALSIARRLRQAEAMIALYSGAKAVVTTRLHCVLPCLGFGTPVLFLRGPRVSGRELPAVELAHHAALADFLAGRDGFNPQRPRANPGAHLALAETLAARCTDFVARPISAG